jgi:hypothetical protein
MKTRSHTGMKILAVALLIALVPAVATAQSAGGIGDWIDRTNAHRVAGYVTLGLATTTAALGLFGGEYHWLAGTTTAAAATVSVSLGAIAYGDRLSYFWPHALLAGLATAGFVTNAFFLEGGSPAHVATGIASVATLYGAYAAILLLTD